MIIQMAGRAGLSSALFAVRSYSRTTISIFWGLSSKYKKQIYFIFQSKFQHESEPTVKLGGEGYCSYTVYFEIKKILRHLKKVSRASAGVAWVL